MPDSEPRPPTPPEWPQATNDDERLELYKAAIVETADIRGRMRAQAHGDETTDELFFASYYDAITKTTDRPEKSAERVQTVAAALAAVYGTIVGVAFSVSDNPLPARGLIPPILLGIALICSTVYAAWPDYRSERAPTTHPENEVDTFHRRRGFLIDYAVIVAYMNSRRMGWLRSAVAALALGLMLFPVPFIEISTEDAPQPPGPSAVILPDWPALPASSSTAAEILYEAQVAEAGEARQRSVESMETRSDPTIRLPWLPEWGWAAFALVLVVVVALFGLLGDHHGPRRSRSQSAPVS